LLLVHHIFEQIHLSIELKQHKETKRHPVVFYFEQERNDKRGKRKKRKIMKSFSRNDQKCWIKQPRIGAFLDYVPPSNPMRCLSSRTMD